MKLFQPFVALAMFPFMIIGAICYVVATGYTIGYTRFEDFCENIFL
jgi:1,4-dihydroxy-2-naphthoate octaprenyltransferase